MDSLGAITWLYEQLGEERSTPDSKKLRVEVKTSITLLVNAVAHFNLERRKSAMKHHQQGSLAKGAFPHRGPWLFGEDYGTKAKSVSDSIKALKTSLGKRKTPLSGCGSPPKKQRYPTQYPQSGQSIRISYGW